MRPVTSRPRRRHVLIEAWREALLIGGASVVLAAGFWAVRGDRLPLRADAAFYELELAAPTLAVNEALAVYTAGTHLFVDVREAATDGEVPGAFRVRPETFDADLADVRDFLDPLSQLVLYDDGVMQTASTAAVRFRERGYPNVTILAGGFAAWRAAGGAVSEGAGDAP